jgi:hypothetical protein
MKNSIWLNAIKFRSELFFVANIPNRMVYSVGQFEFSEMCRFSFSGECITKHLGAV